MATSHAAVEVVAHRGASAHAREHTWAAYDLALALGADALELDLRATADGELVVLHDRTLARTAGDSRPIAGLALAELDALDPARRPLRLEAVLARYGRATRYLLELKDPQPAMERRLVDVVARAAVRDAAVVQSFDAAALLRVRTLDAGLAVAPLFAPLRPARRVRAGLDAVAAWASGIGVHRRTVDAGLVRAAHARGLAVRAYTVNDPGEMASLAALGVDGLITDAPDRARRSILAAVPAAA